MKGPVENKAKKFYQMSLAERLEWLRENSVLTGDDLEAYAMQGGLPLDAAEHMIENVVGLYSLPLGVAQNFVINGKRYLVPMVVEEPSIVAGVSYMAKLAAANGGFSASADEPEMIAQLQLLDVTDLAAAQRSIAENKQALLDSLRDPESTLQLRGGGPKDLDPRVITESPIGPFLVAHLIFDVRDAMGANAVNTAAEKLAPQLEALTGARVHLRILSNLSDRRLARASVRLSPETLTTESFSGEATRDGIIEAWAFAEADPYRAATHNKGVMNGIDAVALATANDWRALEAGAHAWAAHDGRYTSLTTWGEDEQGSLVGSIELPLAVGIIGGATRSHPTARANLKLLGVETAQELAQVMAAVGLAQNLAALRALATEGIQAGHMALHARQIALSAGATGAETERLAAQLVAEKSIKLSRAEEILRAWRDHD